MAFLIKNWNHRELLILGAIGLFGAAVARADKTILVLKSRELPQYTAAVNGFVQEWNARGSGRQVQLKTLTGSAEDAFLLSGINPGPIATVAVGTDAARWAIRNTSGPVVFCMVANAQQNVLAGLGTAELARVTGVALDIPVKIQLSQLRTFLPRVKRVGVLYDPRKSGAAVKEAARAAGELGLELVTQEVPAESSLPEATELIASRIDLLWAPVDSTVFNSRSAQFVLTQMLQHKVPVMGFSENMVKAGALLAPRVNYEAVGKQTAELLQAVLNGRSALETAIRSPRTFDLVVNRRVFNLMGKPIPQSAIQTVGFINEDE